MAPLSVINAATMFLRVVEHGGAALRWLSMLEAIAHSAIDIIALVLFVKRKKLFIRLSIWASVIGIFLITLSMATPYQHLSVGDGLQYCVAKMIVILYLVRSRRVKHTFTVA